jgi:predicted DsbA family dithiol-disulfide isomerase
MRIEIWSDIVCPWCYIGKRRLETALGAFEHADEVEVVYRSFQLDPSAPAVSKESIAEALGAKYGGGAAAGEQMIARVSQVAAEEGLEFDYANARRGNTVDAHRLLHLALEAGGPRLQGAVKEAMLASYFLRAEAVADHDVLSKVAVDAGLDPGRVADVLGSDAYLDEVHADIAQAQAFGASGVPFFVVDRKYAISGAQPAEVFGQVLERAWTESRPALTHVDSDPDSVCGPDGCPV